MHYQFREKVCISFYAKKWNDLTREYEFVKAERTNYIFNRMYIYEAYDFKRRKNLLLAFRATDWRNGDHIPMYKITPEQINKCLDGLGIICHQFATQ